MSEKMMENNRVQVMGEIVSRLSYSHETYGERFYMMDISVCRTSGTKDYIPIMVSERLMDVTGDHIGKLICVEGQFRSYNRHEERRNRLVLSVFAREAGFVDGTGMEGGGDEPGLPGRLYMQGADLPEDAPREGDSGCAARSEPPLWEIRLHTLHLLGEEREAGVPAQCGGRGDGGGQDTEPRVHEEAVRDRGRGARGI